MADLDGDETRHKIFFCDGMLYDFKERVLRSPIPADRMGFHAKATSEMWQPSKATKLFEHILAFLKERLETGVCLLEASENGKQVIECFEELEQDGCEILRHMKVYGDWDSVLLRAASHDQGHLRDAAVLQDVLHLGEARIPGRTPR